MEKNYFKDYIGQEGVKRQLSFLIDGYHAVGSLPPICMIGEKGAGKTYISNQIGKHIGKPTLEISSSSIGSIKSLVNNVFLEYQGQEILFFLDEVHGLKPVISNALLTILGSGTQTETAFEYEGYTLTFDFSKIGFIFATTDPQKVFKPLLNRMQKITFDKYKPMDLARVMKQNAKGVTFSEDALEKLGSFCRGNARSAAQLGANLFKYCSIKDKFNIGLEDIKSIKDAFGVFELGLDRLEVSILESISESADTSLTALCAKTGLEKAPQQELESFLLRLGLIDIIKGRRSLTQKGRNYLNEYHTEVK